MVGALRIVGDVGRPCRSMPLVRTSIRLQGEELMSDRDICNSEAKPRTYARTVEHDISCSLVAEAHKESNRSRKYDCYKHPYHCWGHCREKCVVRRSSEEVGVGQGHLPQS